MRRKNRYTERRKGIVTPYGQWKYPGSVTTIPSNDITMKGVPYPVLGVSDKGDTKMMFPDNDYKFKGKEVTEYPIGKYATGTELHNPLKNMTITSRFSNLYPRVFKGGENRKSPHYGIDLRADIGTDLYSTGDGIVKKIVENPTGSAGRYIVIESPDHTLHTYMHLDSVSKNLKLGQNVKAGEIIGKTGNSGSKDPHLHYQVQLLPEETTFDDFDGINDKRIINRVINPALYDWSQYNGHGLPSIQNNEVYPLSDNIGPSYPIVINPIDTTYYEKNDNIELSNEQSANIMNQKYTYKTPIKLMFPPLFKQQNGGMKKYLEGNYVDFPMSKNRWKPQEEYNDSSWANFLGAGIGAMVPISMALWNKYGNQSNNKSNTLPSDMRDDYSYQRTHHYPVDNSINTDIQQQINDDAENKLKISQNMNFTGPISVTPWNYTMKPFKINYEFPFKSQFGKYLSGNYVNNVISQWNNKFAESISKGDSIANMVGTGINAAASIAGNVLNQWGADNGKQKWMTKQQRGDNTGTMAEIERGEVISTPNGMSIANPNANYHELYTNQNENNGTVVNLSNDVNKDVAKNPTLSRKSARVNKYTSMRRQGRSFIFPSTVGIGGLLEPKNGVEYPMAEKINGSKMQTGGFWNEFKQAWNDKNLRLFSPKTEADKKILEMASYLPIIGSTMDFDEFIHNPTYRNGSQLATSMLVDLFGTKLTKSLMRQNKIDAMITKDARKRQALNRSKYVYPFGIYGFDFMNNAVDNELDKQNDLDNFQSGGSIHIKPSKRGTFTAAATKRGMGVQQFASRVLAHPENYSEAMRKKAQFAKNASHWKHQEGGTTQQNPLVDLNLMSERNRTVGNNRKMNMENMAVIDNYFVSKNVPLPQRQALLYTILQESGADTLDAHGNGYYGLVGWSKDRYNAIKDKSLLGQAEYLYNTLYNGNGSVDWNHGGEGSGYNSWKDARKAFADAQDFDEALRALTYGYVRPANSVKLNRISNGGKYFR